MLPGMSKKSVSVAFLFACTIFSGASAFVFATLNVRATARLQSAAQTGQAAERITMEQLTTAAKHFFRDTAEFPLLQKMTMTVTDSSGRVIKTQNLSVDYVFRGFSPRTNSTLGQVHGDISIWQAIGGAKIMKVALNSDIWTMIAGQELVGDSDQYVLTASQDGTRQDLITAKILPTKPCAAVTMKRHPDDYMTDVTCGASEFQLKDDLSFQKFLFEVNGLPAPVNLKLFVPVTVTDPGFSAPESATVKPPGEDALLLNVTLSLLAKKSLVEVPKVTVPAVGSPLFVPRMTFPPWMFVPRV